MRAFEPEPGERRSSDKPWTAFKAYRDLGPQRTLKAAAQVVYGRGENISEVREHEYVQIRKWAAEFNWSERAESYDAWQEMIGREAIEKHLSSKAADFVARQAAIKDVLLSNAESAAENESKMLSWPLTEQRVVQESEDGTEQTLVVIPANWNKGTAVSMHNIAASAVTGAWAAAKPGAEVDVDTFDYSALSTEEIRELLQI